MKKLIITMLIIAMAVAGGFAQDKVTLTVMN